MLRCFPSLESATNKNLMIENSSLYCESDSCDFLLSILQCKVLGWLRLAPRASVHCFLRHQEICTLITPRACACTGIAPVRGMLAAGSPLLTCNTVQHMIALNTQNIGTSIVCQRKQTLRCSRARHPDILCLCSTCCSAIVRCLRATQKMGSSEILYAARIRCVAFSAADLARVRNRNERL